MRAPWKATNIMNSEYGPLIVTVLLFIAGLIAAYYVNKNSKE